MAGADDKEVFLLLTMQLPLKFQKTILKREKNKKKLSSFFEIDFSSRKEEIRHL